MIISRTPYRISFFGGGTDYPGWYRQHGGEVLAATIDKYCYLTCRYLPPFFEHRYRVVWSKIENCRTIDAITHPAARAILRYMDIGQGVEVHYDGDLPARSGMGSSSSFTVGLLHGMYALLGRMPSKWQLAMESIHIEQNILKETVGSQDQVLAAYGGLNHVTFQADCEFSLQPVTLPGDRIAELNDHLMLFYTGIKRTASDVAQSYVSRFNDKRRQLRIMKDLVQEALAVLNSSQEIGLFGELLHETWQLKRDLGAKISNAHLDGMYDAARAAGALGGKVTGAGGGGFMLLFVPPDRQPAVLAALGELIHVPFRFEFAGSQIIFFEPEEDFSALAAARDAQEVQPFRELASLSEGEEEEA